MVKKAKKEVATHIKEVDYLRIALGTKEMDLVKKDLEISKHRKMILDLQRTLSTYEASTINDRMRNIEGKHEDVIKRISKDLGFDLKGKVINPDTFEIIDT